MIKNQPSEVSVVYNLEAPQLAVSVPPEKVPPHQYWKLQGVDGRFVGGFKTFPGMKLDETLFSSSTSGAQMCLCTDSITRKTAYDVASSTYCGFHFFKYACIQKGATDYLLRGWVIGAALTATPSVMNVVFVHYDTENRGWYSYLIDSGVSVTTSIDVATSGRYLYYVKDGAKGKCLSWATSWFTTAGSPYDADVTLLTVNGGGIIYTDFGPKTVAVTATGWVGSNGYLEAGKVYRIRYRWYSPTRNLWGPLSNTINTAGAITGSGYHYRLQVSKHLVGEMIQAGFTRLYVYRTVENGGAYYLEQIVRWSDDLNSTGFGTPGAADPENDLMCGPKQMGADVYYYIAVGGTAALNDPEGAGASIAIWSMGMNDSAVQLQRVYDPFFDESGYPPQSGLICSYQDMLLMPGKASSNTQETSATLKWSTLYNTTAENFPSADHYYMSSSLGHPILCLVDGGDYAYGVRDEVILRIYRSGRISVNELFRKMGGTGRYGSTAVGQFLYVACPFGLVGVDGTSGKQDIVASVERIFLDKAYWGRDVSDVHLEFDGYGTAMFMLNRKKEEMYVLWFNTGAVTSLEECPYRYMTRGPDPRTGGSDVVWFLGPGGVIVTTDWTGSSGKASMCGARSNEGMNTKVSSVTSRVEFTVSSGVTLPKQATGFWCYFLSGSNRGLKRKISSITVSTRKIILEEALPYDLVANVRVAVAPVVMEVGLPSPRTGQEVDLFVRKGTVGAMTSMKVWGGDVMGTANLNARIVYGVKDAKKGMPCESEAAISDEPTLTAASLMFKGTAPLPYFRIYCGGLDLELQSIQFYGNIEGTDANVKP